MSGCCGQGPVIVSGAAATPRVDVEAVLLCDVLPDGTVAGVALVEPIYDTISGDRVGTRTVNPTTGAPFVATGTLQACAPDGCTATTSVLVLCDVAADNTATQFVRATTYDCEGALLATLDRTLGGAAYTVTGTVGVCPTSPDCESPTTPLTSVGLCLADGTPIAVTVVRDCTGAVTSEGWINLSTGAWSAGTVPVGAVACGESRSIQVSGTFCDVDGAGEVVGLVLVEYTYDDTGAIASVRLVDAVTGGTYTPTGTVTVCPAGVEQPERDILQFCDTATDGTVTTFVRDYARDENGAIAGHSDYGLDGTPYTPTGTVGPCSAEPCRNCEQLVLCDVLDGVSTSFLRTVCRDCTGAVISTLDTALDGTTPYAAAGIVDRCCDTTVLAECWYSLPDTPTGFAFTDPAYPGCWVGTAAAPSYAYGDRVTSWAAVYESDTGSASAVLFSSPDLGGAITFTAFAPALAINPAQSDVAYTGTAVINGVTVTLTATAGNGLGVWAANHTGLYLNGGDGFRLDFSKPVRLTVNTSGFADPPSLHERFCGVTAETVPWPALKLSDCDGNVTAVDPVTREPIPAGAVLECEAECEATAVQAFRLCDLNPDAQPGTDGLRCAVPFLRHFVYGCDGTATFHDTEMDGVTAYTPVDVVECGETAPSLREQVWNTVSVVQDPANPLVFTYTVANSEDPSQTGTVKMTATKAFGGGCGGTPTAPVWNGPVSFTFEPDANVMELADILRVDAIDWDSWEDKVLAPAPSRVESDLGHVLNPGNRWHTASNNNMGHFYFDGPPALVAMFNRNDGGGLACVAPAFGFITLVPGPPCGGVAEIDHIVQPLCDTAATGTVTSFLRHWGVNNSTGLLTALQDTTLNGTTAYVPTGTVTVCGQQPDAPLLTGVRRLTASTTIQNLKTEFPGLQSVSLSVLAGAVNVAMSNGSGHAIPAGASVTWSVADTDDSSLAAASFAGASAASDYFLVWTYKGTAAG